MTGNGLGTTSNLVAVDVGLGEPGDRVWSTPRVSPDQDLIGWANDDSFAISIGGPDDSAEVAVTERSLPSRVATGITAADDTVELEVQGSRTRRRPAQHTLMATVGDQPTGDLLI